MKAFPQILQYCTSYFINTFKNKISMNVMFNDRSSVRPFFPIHPSVYPELAKKFVPSGNGIRIITLDFFWESVRIWGIGIHRTPSWTPRTKSNMNVRTMFGFVLHVNSIFDVHKIYYTTSERRIQNISTYLVKLRLKCNQYLITF